MNQLRIVFIKVVVKLDPRARGQGLGVCLRRKSIGANPGAPTRVKLIVHLNGVRRDRRAGAAART
jgi:hypothetical protein